MRGRAATAAQPVLEQFGELITSRQQQRREPTWLREWRSRAHQALLASGLPGKWLESWHYTPADVWLQRYGEQHALMPIVPDEKAAALAPSLPAGDHLHFNHGYLTEEQLDVADRRKLQLLPLAQLDPTEHGPLLEWVQQHRSVDGLGDLVSALTPESWVLIVRSGEAVKRSVVLSQLSSHEGLQAGQLVIWMQSGAQATLLDDYGATATAAEDLMLSQTLIKLEANSRLTYVRLHRDSDSSQHYGVVEADVGRDAQLRLQSLLGASANERRNRLRNGYHIRLLEPNAEVVARCAFAASGEQHIDYHFTVDHLADHGRSDIVVQGLADDKSRAVINGRIHIAANTRANDGHFTSHNLLLTPAADINAKPELEIYADEVSCSHGATIGQLDEEQILYLLSRGIDREAAIALLTEGFLKAGMLDQLDPDLARFLRDHLLATVGGEHA